jgi:hypothetical protein
LVRNKLSVGAIFFMHNEENAAIKAIDSFLKFYDKSDLILLGNLEESRLKVARHFEMKSYQSQPYIGPLHEHEKKSRENWKKGVSIDLVGIQLQNIYSGLIKLETKYALYLHPDHLLIKKIKFKDYADLESNTPNKYESKLIENLSKKYSKVSELEGYGHPGMLNRDAFLKCYEFFKNNLDVFDEIEAISENLIAYDDFLLPILFKLCGYSVSDNNLTREVRRQRQFKNFRSPLLHQVSH